MNKRERIQGLVVMVTGAVALLVVGLYGEGLRPAIWGSGFTSGVIMSALIFIWVRKGRA